MASLLSLPVELRLHIFSQLLSVQQDHCSRCKDERYKTCECNDVGNDFDGRIIANSKRPTLFFRNVDPMVYRQIATLTWPCWRTVYEVRCDRFRARILDTTYQCMNLSRLDTKLHLLLVNHQLHVEAARLLYGGHTFDFDTHIEAIVPFLTDLTPFSRSCIQSIAVTKRALPYLKEYDRYEWSSAMHYLSDPENGLSLQCIHLDIIAGRPGEGGWSDITPYTVTDYEVLIQTDSMSWLKELLNVRTQGITIRANIEHCPPASNSTAMTDYIRFSGSIEDGLTTFVQKHMTTNS